MCDLAVVPSLVKGGGDRRRAGDGGQRVLAPDGLDAADAQRKVAPEARVDVLAVAETVRKFFMERKPLLILWRNILEESPCARSRSLTRS